MTNPLLKKIVKLDMSMFCNMKLSDICCWEQVELNAAVCGLNIDKALVSFLVLMAYRHDNILAAVSDGIRNFNILDVFDDKVEALESIYFLLDAKTLNSKEIFIAISSYQDMTDDFEVDYNCAVQDAEFNRWKSCLFTAVAKVDIKSLSLFYLKWRRVLHQFDMPFVRFFMQVLESVPNSNDAISRVKAAVKHEFTKQLNRTMFIN